MERFARTVASQAAAPETIGAAKLVPLPSVTPSAVPSSTSNAPGIASGTLTPGAATSTEVFSLLKPDGARFGSTAATDSTCG